MTPNGHICADKWEATYFDYVNPTFGITAALFTIPIICLFIRAYINDQMKTSKPMFYTTTSFFMVVFCGFTGWIFWSINECHNFELATTFGNTVSLCYAMHILLLLGILFLRLYRVFKGTPLRLSKLAVRLFGVCYTFAAILCISFAIIFANVESPIVLFIMPVMGLLVVLLIIFLVYSYVQRLFILYKTSKDEGLIQLMTKTSLLIIICCFTTMLSVVILSVRIPLYLVFIVDLSFLGDIYAHCICIFFIFHYFNDYYMRICGCCNSQCRNLWTKCTSNEDREMVHRGVHADSVTVQSTTDQTRQNDNNTPESDTVITTEN